MSDLEGILRKIEGGAKIRIIQDRYGQEHIEMKGAWLPFKTRIELSREEIAKVKQALGLRARKDRPTVPVKF